MIRDFRRGLENIARWSGGKRGRIIVAGLPSVACAILPAAIRSFLRSMPDIDISVHDLLHERAVADVESGIADLALTIRPARLGNCRFEELGADTLSLVCAPEHPLAKKRRVTWRDLAPYPFVGLSRTSSVRRMTDAAFDNSEIFVEPAYELEQIPSAAALVEAGLGIAALPALTLTMIRGFRVVTRPLTDPVIQRRIGVVTLEERALPQHIGLFLEELHAAFRAGPQ
jgi:LysR family carnitine catabolism transcriptional activator